MLQRLLIEPDLPARYTLQLGEHAVALNAAQGEMLTLYPTGRRFCLHCARPSSTLVGGGYCNDCFQRLARCDSCIVRPETCHYHLGTCREPRWGEQHCFTPHVVYLANTSGLKVGITRTERLPRRWLEQGAIQALPILDVESRRQAGLIETLLRQRISDRTAWQRMLRGPVPWVDLPAWHDRLLSTFSDELTALRQRFGTSAIRARDKATVACFDYPLPTEPTRLVALNIAEQSHIAGRLMGMKGQYLMLDTGVINLRRYGGHEFELSITSPERQQLGLF